MRLEGADRIIEATFGQRSTPLLQTIEIHSPNRDENGNFIGLNHEAIVYDPEAFVEPVRIVRTLGKRARSPKTTPALHRDLFQLENDFSKLDQ